MINNKLVSLEELQNIISNLKTEGKKIVHCHGVFDLLHIGHIRHFEQAKKCGDILIVTLTPDEFVKKGPHNPVFHHNIRTEVLASLDIVDYVALNKWPTAVEIIKFLKPNFYVKGIEYRNIENDYSQGIIAEENAIKEVGGQLKFTDDLVFSSSALINRYMNVFTKETENFLIELSKKYHQKEIINYIEQIKNLKILVIGEAIIDEYCYGKSIGKAGKEPILALKYLKTEKFAGGTLAIANHLADFCDNVTLFTLLGEINTHKDFIEEHLNKKIKRAFHHKKDSPTIVKKRFIEEIPDLKKLLEFYEFNDNDLDYEQTKELSIHLEKILPDYDVVIVADFGHGMLNTELINLIITKSKFLAVNTQVNAGNMGYNVISKYSKADYICLDERELRLECLNKKSELTELLPIVAKRVFCDKILVTQGNQGCIIFSSNSIKKIPAFSNHVVDTMGAGDAFLSITSPLVALNVPLEIIGFIGNAIGALKVKTVGNKEPIEKIALYKYLKSLMSW
ncbi:adenylyltransferase/cytidyltransferase family protein [Candidatus Pacearchaeota archaeon]|nr:adenylyltransferase/cytidyltransferase family protein [Candidatus Pacearchaeota archaeon]MBI2057072.1 adenylyltransferase/cytidyltransferase family protein [Candidatus Pacearchaeota archaeon]